MTTFVRPAMPPAWVLLALLLLVSVVLNLWQFQRKAVADAVEPLQDQLEGFQATAKAEDKIIGLKAEHDEQLAKMETQLKKRATKREIIYRDRVTSLPSAGCAPGQDRVDAWNAAAMAKDVP